LSLRWQVAQKLHAATAPWQDEDNPRFRDVVDLLLLEDLATDLAGVRQACIDVFETRATHSWPPDLSAPESWREAYAALAAELDVEPVDVDAAVDSVRAFVERIDAAK
jgi:Nucleotidyl transferase AbiEii toxin, Type IV TA system